MKSFTIHVLLILLCYNYSYAQPVDSLKVRLVSSISDTSTVKLLAKLGFEYAFIDPDSSRKYCQQAIELADQINFKSGKADALNNLAISYDIEGSHEVAINYFLKALDLYRALNAREGLARIYNNCGMVYQSLGDTTKSLEYHQLSLHLEKELGDSLGIAYSMIQVAALHLNMKQYDQSLIQYTSALALLTSLNDTQGLAYTHWGIGELYLYLQKTELSLKHSKEAYALFQTEENHKGMSETSLIMGKTYLQSQKLELAEEKLLKALALSQELDAKNVVLECLLTLTTLYKAQNNHTLALNFHEKYTVLQDTILKNEMTANIKEIELKYDFELQQQHIDLLNKKNDFQTTLKNIAIGVAAIVAVLLVLLYWAYLGKAKTMEALRTKNREIEKKNEIIRVEKQNALVAAKAKADFLSVMSHEIRTPMNVVIGSIYLLLEDNPRPQQVENLNMLKFSAENLLTLLNDILDLNKLESGKLELESIPFDLSLLTKGLSNGYGVEAKKKGVQFHVTIDGNVPNNLVGDPGRLTQVLNNLISNAIKFTEEGKVTLKIKLSDQSKKKVKLKFSIEDTGIGIPPEKQKLIFENFTQANSETTRQYGGSGLGLSISKQILKLFGSEIALKSQLGKGSTFSFKLKFRTEFVLEKSHV